MKSSRCAFTASPNIVTHNKLYSLAFVCEDVDDPVTRADGEHGEGGESSLELGIAVFAVAEPAKL